MEKEVKCLFYLPELVMFYSEIWRNNMILMFQKWSRGYLYTFIFRYWDNFSVSRIIISIITCSVTSSLRLSKYCSLYFLKCKTIWDINYFKRTDDENYWSSPKANTTKTHVSLHLMQNMCILLNAIRNNILQKQQ